MDVNEAALEMELIQEEYVEVELPPKNASINEESSEDTKLKHTIKIIRCFQLKAMKDILVSIYFLVRLFICVEICNFLQIFSENMRRQQSLPQRETARTNFSL